ncbi:unnamed protein product [Boreogadus saida]
MPRRGLAMPSRRCTPPASDLTVALPGAWCDGGYGKEHYQGLLQEQEERHLSRSASLKRQIGQLKQELQEMGERLKLCRRGRSPARVPGLSDQAKDQEPGDLLEYLHSQIDKAEVSAGRRFPSEYAVVPFESFTRPRTAPTTTTTTPMQRQTYSDLHFNRGLYRTERDKGTLYELFFAKEDSSSFRHVTLFRPFGPLMKVRSTAVETQGVVINVIVPLAGRVETFTQFLLNFRLGPAEPCGPGPRADHWFPLAQSQGFLSALGD